MASNKGREDIPDSSALNAASTPKNSIKQIPAKTEDASSNGTVSSSSFSGGGRNASILRPSVFSLSSPGSQPVVSASPNKTPFSLRRSNLPNPDSSSSATKRPVLLRASQLETIANSPVSTTTSTFGLDPPNQNNPFLKTVSDDDTDEGSCTSTTSIIKDKQEKPNSSNSMGDQVSFVPLASSTSAGSSQTSAPVTSVASAPTFVFGQNLHERVETTTSEPEASEPKNDDGTTSEGAKTNGVTPAMLFTSVIQQEVTDKQSETLSETKKRMSLSEAAKEYEESRAVKRKYEEIAVKTGEEEEINILQINCKLFAFNKEKSTWVERGRGTLRVNDLSQDNKTQSRVVMRVSGSLRLVLNTKIWADMTVDRPSEKSVRLTAMDASGEIKVFLVMAGVKEIEQLLKALEWRVANQKKIATSCEKRLETNKS